MNKPPDLLLVFPPFWDAGTPYLSVPTLSAYLKHHGFQVETADLNKMCLKALLAPESLTKALLDAERVLGNWTSRHGDDDYKRVFYENFRICEQIWSQAGQSLVKDLHTTIPVDVDEYTVFNRRLRWAVRIISAPHHPMPLSPNGTAGMEQYDRLSELTDAVERADLPGFELIDAFAAHNAARGIPVLGISVAGSSQMLPALILAKAYKQRANDAFICIGGPHVPYITDALQHFSKPFDWVDAFVTGEGEFPLRQICQSITHNGEVAEIKGLYIRQNDRVVFTGDQGMVPLDELPPPDFTNFEPDSYLANDGSICLTFARGCSWSRCAFCTQFISFNGYRTMSDWKVTEHIHAITLKHHIRTISLNDENVTPERLLEFGSIIHQTSPNIRWMALARLSPKLADTALAGEVYDSGCTMLSLGLESADQNVLNLNRKGITVESVPAILRNLHDAGIWTHIFLIMGLPGETYDSAVRTIRFFHQNRDVIDSLSPTAFRLERHSTVWQQPEKFDITPLGIPADWCSEEIPFETETWTNRGEAFIFMEYLIQSLVGHRQCPVEQGDLNGQFLIQILERMGTKGLRSKMKKRARATAAAKDALTFNDAQFQKWMTSPASKRLQSDDNSQDILLGVPSRGIFLLLNHSGQKILKLRSLGLSLDEIKKSYRFFIGESDEDATEIEWRVDTFILLVLTSRLIQESLVGEVNYPKHQLGTHAPVKYF